MPMGFQRVQSVFQAVAERPSAERAAVLERECGDDAELRRCVEVLLRAHDDSGELPAANPDRTGTYVPAIEPGQVFASRFKLREKLGEGGMGVVFVAEQTEPVQRRVALKIIRAGLDTHRLLARFEQERQALAVMDHPNIAKVFDAGMDLAQRPYFAMELVKGLSLTRYCDDAKLTPRQRLELFIPICQAVQHAHQKGIIHRDLKPSNILVGLYDGQPVPKVIDFGVAKATGPRLTQQSVYTEVGSIIGTLEYMSPEQAELNNLDIDTRSDIYALGVILYELLTGAVPFSRKELEQAGLAEMLRVIKEMEPAKPSTKLSHSGTLPSIAAHRQMEPNKLMALVRGELDWIVMKALEKDRSRRYETANGFAMDVQRYLADEPVLACPPSTGYQLRKFARRNRGGLAVASLVLFFLVLLGSGAGWVMRDRSAREAEAALQQAERQAKVAGQVESIFADVERLESEQKWPEALEAARRAEAAVAGGEADPATADRVHQRLSDLEFIDRLEQIRMEAATPIEGHFNKAGAEREYARAFRAYGVDVEELPVETSIDRLKARPALAVVLAAALDDWTFLRHRVSNADVARRKRLMAVACGIDPDPLRDRLRATWGQPVADMRDALCRLADSIVVRAQHPATLLILARGLMNVQHTDAALRILREAQSIHPGDFWVNFELGDLLHSRNDREGGIRFWTAAVAVRPRSSSPHNNLGAGLADQGKLDEAMACFRKAVELDPKNANAHRNIGLVLEHKGRVDEAIGYFRKAVELNPKMAKAHLSLGFALQRKGRVDEAIVEYRKAIELQPDVGNLDRAYLDNALKASGRVDEAIAEWKKVIERDPKNVRAHRILGRSLHDRGRFDEAIVVCKKTMELDPKNGHYEHNRIGLALKGKRSLDDAIVAFRKAIELKPDYVEAHVNLGDALRVKGRLDEAIVECRKAIELDPRDATAHNGFGDALFGKGRLDEAIAAFRKALELRPRYDSARNSLIRALQRKGRVDEVITERKKRIELDPLNAVAHCDLGNALKAKEDLDGAERAYREAVRLDGNRHGAAIDALAELLLSRGKLKEAVATCLASVVLDPENPSVHCRLGNALKAKGDLEEAAAAYRAAALAQEKKNPADGMRLYNAACYRALTSAAQAQARGTDSARLAKEEADRAILWLAKAVAAGFADFALLDADADLNSLRDREDFRKLLADLSSVAQAHYYILRSQWDRAAAAYAKVDLLGRALRDDAFAYACLFLIQGDSAGYDRFCQGMIRRAGQTEDHFEAFVLARTCVMARKSPVDPARAVHWGKQAVARAQPAWYFHALGLARYRAGQFDQALQIFTKAGEKEWGSRNLNWFGLALVHHRLGHPDEARRCLDKGVQWLEREGPPGPGRPAKIHPIDWVETQVLRGEVEELLKIKRSP